MQAVLTEDVNHGDWKTVSVFPELYPTLKQGTLVEVIKEWTNFYGLWITVKAPSGQTYDVEPNKLKIISKGKAK